MKIFVSANRLWMIISSCWQLGTFEFVFWHSSLLEHVWSWSLLDLTARKRKTQYCRCKFIFWGHDMRRASFRGFEFLHRVTIFSLQYGSEPCVSRNLILLSRPLRDCNRTDCKRSITRKPKSHHFYSVRFKFISMPNFWLRGLKVENLRASLKIERKRNKI